MTNIIFCGLGGQNIIFLSKLLSYHIIAQNKDIVVYENRGHAKQNGSVIVHMKVNSNSKYPKIDKKKADYMIYTDNDEKNRNSDFIKDNGKLIDLSNINSENKNEKITKKLNRIIHTLAEDGILNKDTENINFIEEYSKHDFKNI